MATEKDLIQVPAQIVDFKPRADRSYKVSFETRELSGREVAMLADNFQGEGWLLFKSNAEVAPEEVPQDEAEAGTKTPSQRLRSVIYLLWKQKGSKGGFDVYYRTSLEKLIEHVKSQLDKED